MNTNLLEKYAPNLKISEAVYAKAHDGERMDAHRKFVISRVLENTESFLRESFENSTGTQRAAFGHYKQFCMSLTDVILPNLITMDLVIVSPMSAYTGSVVYLEYVAGSNKGGVAQDDLFNGVYKMGAMTDDRINYTSERVVESFAYADATDHKTFVLGWKGLVDNSALKNGSVTVAGTAVTYTASVNANGKTQVVLTNALTEGQSARVAYIYDNEVIPQNDIPVLNAKLSRIALEAHARRISVYYSQIANFQAKQDYGFDLGNGLAEQAKAELMYEIDSETVKLLSDAAETDTTLVWSKTLPVGVFKKSA